MEEGRESALQKATKFISLNRKPISSNPQPGDNIKRAPQRSNTAGRSDPANKETGENIRRPPRQSLTTESSNLNVRIDRTKPNPVIYRKRRAPQRTTTARDGLSRTYNQKSIQVF